MVEHVVTIYDEFVGDVDVDVDVLGPSVDQVMYDESEVAKKLEMTEVPESIDGEIREKAVESLIYDDEDWDKYEQARKEWEEAA